MGAAVTREAALVVVDYDSKVVQFAAINRERITSFFGLRHLERFGQSEQAVSEMKMQRPCVTKARGPSGRRT